MSNKTTNDERPAPRFTINKEQGVRHLLHSAIRMMLDGEDPFAINMLGQSADKILLHLLRHAELDDPAEFEDRIVPEHRRDFFRLYRQAFNFLKHANEDPKATLPVYDIIATNEVLLFINILRYRRLFSTITVHMQMYFFCAALLHPTLIKWQEMGEKGHQIVAERRKFEYLTRRDALELFRDYCYGDGQFLCARG